MSPPGPAENHAPSGQSVVERPPEGIARGPLSAPAWVVIGLGVVAVVIGLTTFVRRMTRRSNGS